MLAYILTYTNTHTYMMHTSYYCGMKSAMAVQKWPEDHPHAERLKDEIVWLGGRGDELITDGLDEDRLQKLNDREHVPLLD